MLRVLLHDYYNFDTRSEIREQGVWHNVYTHLYSDSIELNKLDRRILHHFPNNHDNYLNIYWRKLEHEHV